ncbi:MAG: hypothetical protein AAB306_05985 [Pseudomonadota bacterium]
MKILVNFKSGLKLTFIVPKSMLAIEFRKMAEDVGGKIHSLEFSLPARQSNFSLEKPKDILQLPDKTR